MGKTRVIVLCGSSRFCDIMSVCAWLLEKEEQVISMGLHLLPVWYRSPSRVLPDHHLAEHEGVADAMDQLHLRKIDLADEIFVVNKEFYIGYSTRNEINYAESRGLPIRYYTDDYIGGKVYDIIAAFLKEKEQS